jgi:hypothetical protein
VPLSTDQVLNPALFLASPPDEPTTVTLPAPRGATSTYQNDMGEFGTRLVVYRYLDDAQTAARAAAGWDGDRFMIVEGSGDRGIVWAIVWDSAIEAAEFTDAMARAVRRHSGAGERSIAGGGTSFSAKNRTISIVPRSIGDRAVVIFSDLPDAMGSGVIDPAAIRLGK